MKETVIDILVPKCGSNGRLDMYIVWHKARNTCIVFWGNLLNATILVLQIGDGKIILKLCIKRYIM
jgi:hypothetical protein